MSPDMPQQSIPIIIKSGGGGGGEIDQAKTPIDINANSIFKVTEEYNSQPTDWLKSDSHFTVSYVESIAIGENGKNMQFCQTSRMSHPLTFAFKDAKGKAIFTIVETADDKNFSLQFSVDYPDCYFQVSDTSKTASKGFWSDSIFSMSGMNIHIIEVIDSNNIPVCQLLRFDNAEIFLNLEPPV